MSRSYEGPLVVGDAGFQLVDGRLQDGHLLFESLELFPELLHFGVVCLFVRSLLFVHLVEVRIQLGVLFSEQLDFFVFPDVLVVCFEVVDLGDLLVLLEVEGDWLGGLFVAALLVEQCLEVALGSVEVWHFLRAGRVKGQLIVPVDFGSLLAEDDVLLALLLVLFHSRGELRSREELRDRRVLLGLCG